MCLVNIMLKMSKKLYLPINHAFTAKLLNSILIKFGAGIVQLAAGDVIIGRELHDWVESKSLESASAALLTLGDLK